MFVWLECPEEQVIGLKGEIGKVACDHIGKILS